MGIAAYNRGSRAISNHLYPKDVRYTAPTPKPEDDLPEGILRSTYMPDSDVQVFLSYENRWYIVHTRFQILKRKRNYQAAVSIFEKVEMWGRCAL